jgi:hypothetical protein
MHSFPETDILTLHDSPGRLRLAVPGMVGSKAQAAACEAAARSLPGVQSAEASALTGSLLVRYTPTPATRTVIEGWWRNWNNSAGAAAPGAAGQPARSQTRMLAVVVELLPHVLPLVLGRCPICGG